MMRNHELTFRLFNRHRFPTPDAARALLACFVEAGNPITPMRYGNVEPLRNTFDPDDLSGPAEMLSQRPRDLFIARAKPSYTGSLTWKEDEERPWTWGLYFGRGWIGPDTRKLDAAADFAFKLCRQFPPVFAVMGTSEDWAVKHAVRDPWTGGMHLAKGAYMAPGEGLPGVYWLTFFGPELTALFGRDRLLGLPVERTVDCGESGVGVLVFRQPDEGTPEWRRERELAVVAVLGEEYFFNASEAMKKDARPLTRIPGVNDY